MGFGASFGFSRNEEAHPEVLLDARALTALLVRTVAKSGNLELNVGPTGDGRIPASMQTPLRALGRWLSVNGEAVYNTSGYIDGDESVGECDSGGGGVTRCWTHNLDAVFAVHLGFEVGLLSFPRLMATASTRVVVLGREADPLSFTTGAGGHGITVDPPLLSDIEGLPYTETGAWTLRFEGVTKAPKTSDNEAETTASASCAWRAGRPTEVEGGFSCSTGAGGAVSSVAVRVDGGPAPDGVHSYTTRTVVYARDEPAFAERFKVASITIGMGNGSVPSNASSYTQERLALALDKLEVAATAGVTLARLLHTIGAHCQQGRASSN